MYVYAQQCHCSVLASTDGMTVCGRASSLVQFACRCYIAGIFFTAYRLHPRGLGPYFRLWVVA